VSRLADRTAIILGRDAIGEGIATRFADEGATVRDAGSCDILVINLLGQPEVAPLDAQGAGAFSRALASVEQAANAMAGAMPAMREAGWGRIVVVGHRYGDSVSEAIGPYNAAAWALKGLVRTAALDWGRYGITTNLLLPFAATPELTAARERRPKVIDLLVGQLPLRRAGDPVQDIGAAAVFLACDEGAWINGETVHADGGLHVAGPPLNPARFT
jgi:NAD(P)-dependent dehydrogenase (short-subunit alcohol dehydrogenase family)